MAEETCKTCKHAGQSDETKKHYCKLTIREILLWGTCLDWERFVEAEG